MGRRCIVDAVLLEQPTASRAHDDVALSHEDLDVRSTPDQNRALGAGSTARDPSLVGSVDTRTSIHCTWTGLAGGEIGMMSAWNQDGSERGATARERAGSVRGRRPEQARGLGVPGLRGDCCSSISLACSRFPAWRRQLAEPGPDRSCVGSSGGSRGTDARLARIAAGRNNSPRSECAPGCSGFLVMAADNLPGLVEPSLLLGGCRLAPAAPGSSCPPAQPERSVQYAVADVGSRDPGRAGPGSVAGSSVASSAMLRWYHAPPGSSGRHLQRRPRGLMGLALRAWRQLVLHAFDAVGVDL